MTAVAVGPGARLDAGQVAGYLARVGIEGPEAATPAWLRRAHLAHLERVPFENLEISAGRPIRLDLDGLYDKLVTRRRGGFCYELNGLFQSLLTSVGFDVTLVSSRVWMPDGSLSEPFDHAALIVHLEGDWLVDVGYGDAFQTPHRLGERWDEPGRPLRTIPTASGWRLEADRGEGWSGMYDLDPTPRRLAEFVARCRWHETAPDSPFRQGPLVSRATPTGRVTVAGRRLVVTVHGRRTERQLPADATLDEALRTHFDAEVASTFARLPDERGRVP